MRQAGSKGYHRDPANRWLRQIIFDDFADMPPAGSRIHLMALKDSAAARD
jgi:hypothetical protein